MPYIGQQPAPKVITSSDLADDVVTAAKIGDTAISGFSALTTEPADTDEFLISDGGVLKRLDASLVGGGSLVKISSATASDTANITFDSSVITSTYKYYQIHCIDVLCQTDGTALKFNISVDNGSNYLNSGGSILLQANDTGDSNDAISTRNNTSQTGSSIFGSVGGFGNSTNEVGQAIIHLFNPSGSRAKLFIVHANYLNNNGELQQQDGHHAWINGTAYNNIKIQADSGNITSGFFTLYGVTP